MEADRLIIPQQPCRAARCMSCRWQGRRFFCITEAEMPKVSTLVDRNGQVGREVMNRLKLVAPMWDRAFGAAAIVLLCLSVARPAAAQTVTSADIQRLQDQVYDASNDVSRMKGNPDTAARLRPQLDDLRDEVVYLKVKLRKEGSVSRSDFNDVQNRIQSVRSRVRTEASSSNSGGWHTNSDAEGASTRGGVYDD